MHAYFVCVPTISISQYMLKVVSSDKVRCLGQKMHTESWAEVLERGGFSLKETDYSKHYF